MRLRRPSLTRSATSIPSMTSSTGSWGRWLPPAPPRCPLRRAGQVADAELVEGELEDRVRVTRILDTVPEHVGRVVSLRDRAIARREVDRGGEGGVAVRLVLVVVAPLGEVSAPVHAGFAEVHGAGLGEGGPELVPVREEGDVVDEVAVDVPHDGVVRARIASFGVVETA